MKILFIILGILAILLGLVLFGAGIRPGAIILIVCGVVMLVVAFRLSKVQPIAPQSVVPMQPIPNLAQLKPYGDKSIGEYISQKDYKSAFKFYEQNGIQDYALMYYSYLTLEHFTNTALKSVGIGNNVEKKGRDRKNVELLYTKLYDCRADKSALELRGFILVNQGSALIKFKQAFGDRLEPLMVEFFKQAPIRHHVSDQLIADLIFSAMNDDVSRLEHLIDELNEAGSSIDPDDLF